MFDDETLNQFFNALFDALLICESNGIFVRNAKNINKYQLNESEMFVRNTIKTLMPEYSIYFRDESNKPDNKPISYDPNKNIDDLVNKKKARAIVNKYNPQTKNILFFRDIFSKHIQDKDKCYEIVTH